MKLHLHADGGVVRTTKSGTYPVKCAVIVSTEATDGSFAFQQLLGGDVTCNTADFNDSGPEACTFMTAEITAQVYRALYVLRNNMGLPDHIPVDMVYDNDTAAAFARAVAAAGQHKSLHALAGYCCKSSLCGGRRNGGMCTHIPDTL